MPREYWVQGLKSKYCGHNAHRRADVKFRLLGSVVLNSVRIDALDARANPGGKIRNDALLF